MKRWAEGEQTAKRPRALVQELVIAFSKHIQPLYRTASGRDSGIRANLKPTLRRLAKWYGTASMRGSRLRKSKVKTSISPLGPAFNQLIAFGCTVI